MSLEQLLEKVRIPLLILQLHFQSRNLFRIEYTFMTFFYLK